MGLLKLYIEIFYRKFRTPIFIVLNIMLFSLVLLMVKIIVFDFPINDGENIVDYYASLSQLFGGIIGGLLTVIGVAITIFFANGDRKQDLELLDKPKLMTGGNVKADLTNEVIAPKLCTFNEIKERKVFYKSEIESIQSEYSIANYKPFDIYITNNADCILEGIILGNTIIYPFDFDFILKKGNTYSIDISQLYFINLGKSYEHIDLICSSLNEKKYFYTISGSEKTIEKGKRKIIEIKVDYLAERTKGYNKLYKKLEKQLDEEFFNYVIQKKTK